MPIATTIKNIDIKDATTGVVVKKPIGTNAENVDYDNSNSGLTADDVQGALDEIVATMGGGTAADITYDNSDSELSADNVQDAIDEIVVDINSLSASVLSITDDINDIELTIADLSASKLGYDNTQSGLSGDTIQEAIDELAGQDSGHTYKNDSGTSMIQRSNAKFKGIYIEDDSINNTTNINIVREFQSDAEVQALTGEAAKGFQYTPDTIYRARAAADITFDNTSTSFENTRLQEVLEEVDERLGEGDEGHTIVDGEGTALTQRSNLQFTDAHTSDDSQSNTTKVEIAKQVTTQQWESATEQGFYLIDDDTDDLLDASQVRGLADIATSGNASDLTQDASNILVSDTEKTTWNGKLDKSTVSSLLYFNRAGIGMKTTAQLNAHGGMALSSLTGQIVSAPTIEGYTFVSHLYVEISGAVGVSAFFDSVAKTGTQTNVNPFIYNASNSNIAVGTNIAIGLLSMYVKNV